MTIPTGSFSASDLNVELRRPWNQPLSADDFLLRSILGRQYQRIETSAAEYRGKYLYSPYGTIMQGPFCRGTTLTYLVADGNGGSFEQPYEYNSIQCGYSPPVNNNPPRGTLLQEYCFYGSLMGVYADGNGGSYEDVRQANSPSCAPVDSGGG